MCPNCLNLKLFVQEVAQKLIQSPILADELGNAVNPLDAHFRSLGLSSMDPVPARSDEFATLQSYVKDTHGIIG